jgi:hypothetical protein
MINGIPLRLEISESGLKEVINIQYNGNRKKTRNGISAR